MAGHQALAFFLVFVGGGLGSMLRLAANLAGTWLFGASFPSGTLFVNVIGSLTMGLIAGWLALRGEESEPIRLLLATGLVGGFTTFSAFSLDAVQLWERGATTSAILYVAVSVTASIIGVLIGLGIIRVMTS